MLLLLIEDLIEILKIKEAYVIQNINMKKNSIFS